MQYWFLLLLKLGICFCLMRHRLLPIWASLCIADTQSKHPSQQSLPIGESLNPEHSVLHILDLGECISSRVGYPQSLDASCTPTVWESQLTVNTFGDLHWDLEALRPSSH
ncbi:MAG: hypothetical protein NXY57DRAFT_77770 [Lentinula lateritia]|nr:MAG: hypothetical protein NXY57DRAFT_77770 [Lentinula lateritia]